MEFTVTIMLLFSLSTQWLPVIKGSENGVKLVRHEEDIIYSSQCQWTSRSTGGWEECMCKSEYATVMSKDNEVWDCRTPQEIGCQFTLGELDKTFVITKTNDEVEFVPSLIGTYHSIENIFIWNYGGIYFSQGHWDDVTDAVSRFFAVRSLDGDKNKLFMSDLDLSKWRGIVVKVVLKRGMCVVAKMSGKISYPIDIDEFKQSLITTTTSSPETTASVMTKTTKKTKPTTTTRRKSTRATRTTTQPKTITQRKRTTTITPPSTITQRHNTTIIKTTTPETTASVITRTPEKLKSKLPTTYIIIGVVLAVALVATVSIFMFRRRRLAPDDNDQQTSEGSTEHKLRNVCVENIYNDTQNGKSIIIDDVEDSVKVNGTDDGMNGKKAVPVE